MADGPDETPGAFLTVDLFAMNGPGGGRGVLAGVHIHHVPTGVRGRDVALALSALADTLADGELDRAFRSILADRN